MTPRPHALRTPTVLAQALLLLRVPGLDAAVLDPHMQPVAASHLISCSQRSPAGTSFARRARQGSMNSGKGFCFADVQALVPGIAQRHPALKHLRSLGETQAPASGATQRLRHA